MKNSIGISLVLCSFLTGCIELEQASASDDLYDGDNRENVAGGGFVSGYSDEGFVVGNFLDPNFILNADGSQSCSTRYTLGLSEQILQQVSCMMPTGTLRQVDFVAELDASPSFLPYLSDSAFHALLDAKDQVASATINNPVRIKVNSGYRSLAQQHILHTWHEKEACNISLAAMPGSSNHESGFALDIQNFADNDGLVKDALLANDWTQPHSTSDAVHFEYPGIDITLLSTRAFQMLWNEYGDEYGNDIAEDGIWGAKTQSAVEKSPAHGFAGGYANGPLDCIPWDGNLF